MTSKIGVSGMVQLMRRASSFLVSHHSVERDSRKTDGVLGTKIVRRKTDENLGRTDGMRQNSIVC
jgi:hypothetical protein